MNPPPLQNEFNVDANVHISLIAYDNSAEVNNSVFVTHDSSEIVLSDTVFENNAISNNSFERSPPKNDVQEQQDRAKSSLGHTSTPRKHASSGKLLTRFNLYSDGGVAVCRICHSSEASCPFSNGEPLISPCHCRGSTGLYHRTCLERWLSAANKDKCEICKFQYHVERQPKRLFEFLTNPGSDTIRRHIISDLICWLILTPTAIIGAWLCIAGATGRASAHSSTSDPDTFDRIQVPTLVGLAVFLIATYLIWSVICVRYHLKIWQRWRIRNYRIRVLDEEEAKKQRSTQLNKVDEHDSNYGFQLRRNIRSTTRERRGNDDDNRWQRSADTVGPPMVPAGTGTSGTNYSSPWTTSVRIATPLLVPSPVFSTTSHFNVPPLASLREIDL